MKTWLSNTRLSDVDRIQRSFPGWGITKGSPKDAGGKTSAQLLAAGVVGLYREEPCLPSSNSSS